jgi:hypothetical protein
MKAYIFFVMLLLGFVGVITAMTRPDLVEAKYLELRAPFDKDMESKKNQIWEEAKAAERSAWMLKLQLPAYCNSPSTALHELECKNIQEQHRLQFARAWNAKVKSGWKPDGVSS